MFGFIQKPHRSKFFNHRPSNWVPFWHFFVDGDGMYAFDWSSTIRMIVWAVNEPFTFFLRNDQLKVNISSIFILKVYLISLRLSRQDKSFTLTELQNRTNRELAVRYLGGRGLLSPMSITAALANRKHRSAHVCRRGGTVLSSECVSLLWDGSVW